MSTIIQPENVSIAKISVDRMIALLHEENSALAAMDFARAGELLPIKCSVAETLTVAWRTSRLIDVPAKAKRALALLVEENRRLTKGAMKAHMRALDQVSRAIETNCLSHSSQSSAEHVISTLGVASLR